MFSLNLYSNYNELYDKFIICYPFNFSRTELVPAYVRLLRDNEAEVRIAAAGKVTKFCRILDPELAIQHILPCVKVHSTVQNLAGIVNFSLVTECGTLILTMTIL